jgi:hypothetical protein
MSTGRRVGPADVSRFAREVVARRALILLAVAAVLHVGVASGWLPGDISEGAEATVAGIIDGIAAIGAIFWVRSGTTPADPALAPVSSNGVALVEAPAQHRRGEDGERLVPSNVHRVKNASTGRTYGNSDVHRIVEPADRTAREHDPLT